ncbi:hypothetical protein AABB24_024450 [Solanum stoloniferum]|uniref:Uncharacterized protein n=1 Tax=Solanum stoloniferum TaxID=62892 RepID=A0ABD2SNP1_9SOLN
MCIWEKEIPFRILVWRIWFQKIPIGEVLVKIKVTDSLICCSCKDNCQELFNICLCNVLFLRICGVYLLELLVYKVHLFKSNNHWINGGKVIVLLSLNLCLELSQSL